MCAFFNSSKALICQQIIFSFIFVVSIIFNEIQENEHEMCRDQSSIFHIDM